MYSKSACGMAQKPYSSAHGRQRGVKAAMQLEKVLSKIKFPF
jgi:hypothetical protein